MVFDTQKWLKMKKKADNKRKKREVSGRIPCFNECLLDIYHVPTVFGKRKASWPRTLHKVLAFSMER